jgi:hypothetical protein
MPYYGASQLCSYRALARLNTALGVFANELCAQEAMAERPHRFGLMF